MGTGLKRDDVTIASGAAVSSSVCLNSRRLVGFITPATLTNTAFDVQGATDNAGTVFADISTLQSIAAPASTIVSLNPIDTVCAQFVRLQGASNEGGARTITLLSQETV